MKNVKNKYQVFLVTGNCGIGKTHYLNSLKKLLPEEISNVFVINCDKIVKNLYLKDLKIKNFFLNELKIDLWKNNKLDVDPLLKFILKDKNNLEKIENFIWPLVIEKIQEKLLFLKNNYDFFSLYIEGSMRFCLSKFFDSIYFDKIIFCINDKNNLTEKFSTLTSEEKKKLINFFYVDNNLFIKILKEKKIKFKVKKIEFI